MHRRRAVLALVAFAALLAACANPGYDASKLQRQLRDAGVNSTQARCVTDALENTFDPGQLGSRSQPSAQEDATTAALLKKCGVNVSSPTH